MKIVDVRVTGLSGGTVDGGWPQGNKPEEDLNTLVEVLTDEGPSGVGSCMTSKSLVAALADQVRPKQLDRRGDERLARHAAAYAGDALVGEHLDERVEVLLGLVALGPAAIDGPARQAGDADIDDLHRSKNPIGVEGARDRRHCTSVRGLLHPDRYDGGQAGRG